MNPKALIPLLAVLLIFSSVSAFQLKTTVLPTELTEELKFYESRDDYEQHEVIGAEGTEVYTLTTRHKADYPAEVEPVSINITEGMPAAWIGDFDFTLDGYWPKAYLRGGTCAGTTCTNGPMFRVTATRDDGQYCGSGWMSTGQAEGKRICQQGDLSFQVTSVQGPEYKETRLYSGVRVTHWTSWSPYETWYLVLGPDGVKSGMGESTSKEVIVDFCVSLKIDGAWSDCVNTREELAELAKQYAKICPDDTPEGMCVEERSGNAQDRPMQCSQGELIENCSKCGCPQGSICGTQGTACESVADQVSQNTDDITLVTDSATASVAPSCDVLATISNQEIERCTEELNRAEANSDGSHPFVAKTRFKYDRGIGCPPGETGWNEFVHDEVEESVPVEVADRFTLEVYNFFPRLVRENGSEEKEPKFGIRGLDSGNLMDCNPTYYDMTGHVIYGSLNEEMQCDRVRNKAIEFYPSIFLRYKVYDYKAPFFKKTAADPEGILMKGQHCYDVWAYLAVKWKMDSSRPDFPYEYSWWMRTEEELENFLNALETGGNLKIRIKDELGNPVEGASVTITFTVEGEEFTFERTTLPDGMVGAHVPLDTEITVTVTVEGYGTKTTTVTVSDTLEDTITIEATEFDLRVAYSRADFWKLYYEVVPFFHGEPTVPFESNDNEFLASHAPAEEDHDKLYIVVPQFLKLKTGHCDDASAQEVSMGITRDYTGESIIDKRGYQLPLYYVMVFRRTLYGGTYYACYRWPAGGAQPSGDSPAAAQYLTVEIPWQIDGTGGLEEIESQVRIIEGEHW